MRKTFIIASALTAILFALSSPAIAAEFPHSKQKQCGMEWKASTERETKSMGWPQYWSQCSKRHNEAKNTFAKQERKLSADDVIRVQKALAN
jgi:hypothetical protein